MKCWLLFSIHQIYRENKNQLSQLIIDEAAAPLWSQEVGEARGEQKVRSACVSACCWKTAHNGMTAQKAATDKDCLLLVLPGGRRARSGKTDTRGSLKRWNMKRDQGICLNEVQQGCRQQQSCQDFFQHQTLNQCLAGYQLKICLKGMLSTQNQEISKRKAISGIKVMALQ